MTKDEALDLALEALESERPYLGPMPSKTVKAITAIKQARSAPVQEPVAWMPIETAPQDGTKILGWNEEFGARETQMTFYGEGSPGFAAWKSGKGPKESGWNWSEPKSSWSHTWKPTHWKPLLTPLYTTPPAAQRQWVGLTDEDLTLCESEEDVRFVRAIEAKLKEKNA
jgi:hypothetical protein